MAGSDGASRRERWPRLEPLLLRARNISSSIRRLYTYPHFLAFSALEGRVVTRLRQDQHRLARVSDKLIN